MKNIKRAFLVFGLMSLSSMCLAMEDGSFTGAQENSTVDEIFPASSDCAPLDSETGYQVENEEEATEVPNVRERKWFGSGYFERSVKTSENVLRQTSTAVRNGGSNTKNFCDASIRNHPYLTLATVCSCGGCAYFIFKKLTGWFRQHRTQLDSN